MFAQNQIVYRIPARTYTHRFNTKCSVNKTFRASMHNLSDENSMAISEVKTTKLLHIIAFERDGREGFSHFARSTRRFVIKHFSKQRWISILMFNLYRDLN
jgi:hypothetical protein